ncbi:carbon-nitrogen hydrolase [Exidia glandulosa HHB12029]|uniref:Carbon-nitrogen hydrolase n=1 Tax=Exidia glandulosa HHB12029 TaxID=1314781 RepID=A0A165DPT0_EXIGL|nr:carbon-nitrogen hydrolase [Exidia glandulosa HHB12029]
MARPRSTATARIRVGVVQFDPKLGQPERNQQRVEQLVDDAGADLKDTLDVLVLPEMALSGYVFRSPDAVRPFLENSRDGRTTTLARSLARRLGCTVVAGYPQQLDDGEQHEQHQVGANAAVVSGRDGEIITTYRKTNMYDVDLAWCVPGTGFKTFDLRLPDSRSIRVALGICMDLNPDRDAGPAWTYEDGPFELADFVIQQNARILILINAWLLSEQTALDTAKKDKYDEGTVKYWVARLDPLWDKTKGDRAVVIANRCGEEDGVYFAGSSVVLRYSAAKDRVSIIQVLGRAEEAVLRCTVTLEV